MLYDAGGRTLSETNDGRAVTHQYDTLVSSNDNAGNRTRTTWPDGYFVTYQYDGLHRVIDVRENSTSATDLGFYVYDPLSRHPGLFRDHLMEHLPGWDLAEPSGLQVTTAAAAGVAIVAAPCLLTPAAPGAAAAEGFAGIGATVGVATTQTGYVTQDAAGFGLALLGDSGPLLNTSFSVLNSIGLSLTGNGPPNITPINPFSSAVNNMEQSSSSCSAHPVRSVLRRIGFHQTTAQYCGGLEQNGCLSGCRGLRLRNPRQYRTLQSCIVASLSGSCCWPSVSKLPLHWPRSILWWRLHVGPRARSQWLACTRLAAPARGIPMKCSVDGCLAATSPLGPLPVPAPLVATTQSTLTSPTPAKRFSSRGVCPLIRPPIFQATP